MKFLLNKYDSFNWNIGGSLAIVGSSGNLLSNSYGKLIDSHNIVMRFNAARVVGFETYVGSKTNIRIMNGHCFAGMSGDQRFSKNDPNFISSLKNEHFYIKGFNPQEFMRGVLNNSNQNYINFLDEEYIEYCGSYDRDWETL